MINIKDLTPSDFGRYVVYAGRELGKIKGWNDNNIFVVYKCNDEWDRFHEFTGQSTNPKDLVFADNIK